MQKLLSTLLTIIFFQANIFAFPISVVAFNNCNSNSLTATKTLFNLPNNIKETYYATVNASNVKNLQTLGYNIGDRVYDYKENPMLLAKDATSLFISYDMYEAGFNNDNMFYGSALVLGGLALDIAGAPIKAGKGVIKTAKATEKIAKKTDFYVTAKGTAISTAQKDVDNLVSKLDVSTPKDKAVFYSGGEINKNAAKEFTGRNKLLTIENTSGGLWLKEQELYGNVYRTDNMSKTADMYWGTLSKKYAGQASGTAHAFVEGADKNRVFWQIEYPTLKSNLNINGIYFYNEEKNIIKWEKLKQ